MIDLLGDDLPLVRTNDRPEAAALIEVLMALTAHSAVAWCERMNSGAGGVAFMARDCRDVFRELDGRLPQGP